MSDPHDPATGAPWRGQARVRPRPAPPWYPPPEPPPRSTAARLGLAFALGLIVALLAIAGLGLTLLPEQAGAPRAAATMQATIPAAPPSPTGPGLGQPARDGSLEFVVDAVGCGHPTEGDAVLHATARGQFCEVRLRVRNVGTHARVFAGRLQKAIGPGGVTYADDVLAELYANAGNQTLLRQIDPGTEVHGILVFDIPKDARILGLHLHDSPLSEGVTVTVGRPAPR